MSRVSVTKFPFSGMTVHLVSELADVVIAMVLSTGGSVGFAVGPAVGGTVGDAVGGTVGACVGVAVGLAVGVAVGWPVGVAVGEIAGGAESVAACVGIGRWVRNKAGRLVRSP